MDTNIKISIILPVYNGELSIQRSIESVLTQSFKNFELLILNDGSLDTTESIIKSFTDSRILYIKNEKNIGLIGTLNKAILLAQGKYIARIDADDIWIDVEKLSKQINFLEENPEHILIGTQAILKTNTEKIKTEYPLSDLEIRKNILSKNPFIHSSVVFKKEHIKNILYKKEDYLVEDYSIWLQLGLLGSFINLPDFCVEYFINPKGETQTKNLKQTLNSFNLIKKYKNKYPNYLKGYYTWLIKILIRRLRFHFKQLL